MTIGDRICVGDLAIPRESCLPILADIVTSGKIKFNPQQNNFPVTMHDPCNIVRLMGIEKPQWTILNAVVPKQMICPMPNAGSENYCCGGGSGFAIINSQNFPQWRTHLSSRRKARQVLEAFKDVLDPSIAKYYCAPCSNCKGSARDSMIEAFGFKEKYNITYGGLVELMVNAMPNLPQPYISWEDEF